MTTTRASLVAPLPARSLMDLYCLLIGAADLVGDAGGDLWDWANPNEDVRTYLLLLAHGLRERHMENGK